MKNIKNHSMSPNISEIFNSIQGEGLYVGIRQVFLRFTNCQLWCNYCDTPQTRKNSELCKIEKISGSGKFEFIKNPLRKDKIKEIIEFLWSNSTKHISLTGGEPLIHAEFIRDLELEYPLYLETNSGFPEKAKMLKDIIQVAACDIKLPEHKCTENYDELLKNELETISIFNENTETFVKIIVLQETTKESLSFAIDGIASIDKNIPLILQPVTSKNSVSPRTLLELMDFAGEKLKEVRAVPQTHKMMGQL